VQLNGVVTLSWRKPESVVFRANPDVRYTVTRNDTKVAEGLTDTVFVDTAQPNGTELSYRVTAAYRYGVSPMSVAHTVRIDLAAEDSRSVLPTVFALYGNYPNPFNPETRIRLDVPMRSPVSLEIFDVTGRLVRTLYQGTLAAGTHELTWDSRDNSGRTAATGLYFCRMVSPTFEAAQKMLLVK
jgi:hypothetical protein